MKPMPIVHKTIRINIHGKNFIFVKFTIRDMGVRTCQRLGDVHRFPQRKQFLWFRESLNLDGNLSRSQQRENQHGQRKQKA